jgi:riboflavin kinase / FMN adenylyltransferase
VDRIDSDPPRAVASGVASVGERPTFCAGPSVEAHLFDFAADLYGAKLRMHLLALLRPEEKFPDAAALVAQMQRDARMAREILAGRSPDPSGVFF